MSTPTSIRAARKAKRGTYRYADMVLNGWDRLFAERAAEPAAELDAAAKRQRRRDEKWQRAEVERRAKSRL